MKRSEAIKRTAAMMGGVLFAPTLAGLMSGCAPNGRSEEFPTHFSTDQAQWIRHLSDTILPATETPGAIDVGVPEWMERMVFEIYAEDTRSRFLEGLEDLMAMGRERVDSPLDQWMESEQRDVVEWFNREMVTRSTTRPAMGSFRIIKELTLLGYYTSEAGATQELRYLPVPGRYEGCVPYDEIGVAWAT